MSEKTGEEDCLECAGRAVQGKRHLGRLKSCEHEHELGVGLHEFVLLVKGDFAEEEVAECGVYQEYCNLVN
jgi:hypothetical protein